MTLQAGYITVGRQRLEMKWYGPGPEQAPTLVLLHEGLGCVALWKDFPERLAQATGWGVLVYSRAGYGQSDPVTLPRPLTYMHEEARDVLPRLLDAVNVQRAVLVGHSDGASIALIHAGAVKDPRIHGLVLMAPHVFTEPMCLDSIAAARTAYNDPGTRLRARLARYHHRVDVAFRGWNDAWLDPGFVAWNLQGFLTGVVCPVLMIQGHQDEYGTAAQLEAITDGVRSRCETHLLDDCRHSPHRDQPAATLDAILSFLTTLPSTQETPTHG